MATVALKTLRRKPLELIRRAEQGELIYITRNGHVMAQLAAITESSWRRWDDVSDIFSSAEDHQWIHERDLIDQRVGDTSDAT